MGGSQAPLRLCSPSLPPAPAWCLRNEGVSSVLLGASNADQLMENIGAIQVSTRHGVLGDCSSPCAWGCNAPWRRQQPGSKQKCQVLLDAKPCGRDEALLGWGDRG